MDIDGSSKKRSYAVIPAEQQMIPQFPLQSPLPLGTDTSKTQCGDVLYHIMTGFNSYTRRRRVGLNNWILFKLKLFTTENLLAGTVVELKAHRSFHPSETSVSY